MGHQQFNTLAPCQRSFFPPLSQAINLWKQFQFTGELEFEVECCRFQTAVHQQTRIFSTGLMNAASAGVGMLSSIAGVAVSLSEVSRQRNIIEVSRQRIILHILNILNILRVPPGVISNTVTKSCIYIEVIQWYDSCTFSKESLT